MEVVSTGHSRFDEEVDHPTYRVHFWEIVPGWAPRLDAYRLSGDATVTEALAWIEGNHADRAWELFAVVDVPRILGAPIEEWAIRLHGESPVGGERDEHPSALGFERGD